MKFDDRYEHIQIGFRDNQVGVIRGLNKKYCSQCRSKTYWIHMETKKIICSEKCLEKLQNEVNHKNLMKARIK